VVEKVRGKPGSAVALLVLRGSELKTFQVVRGVVQMPTVSSQLLAANVGYLRIASFTERSGGEVERALEELLRLRVRGLVLDLRGNQGGALEQVIQIAARLVPAGKLVVTLEKRGETVTHQGKGRMLGEIPTAVIVDRQTASGAELLARALRENELAVVVGTPTFGKNTVEKVEEIGEELAIKYTVARWRSPRGQNQAGSGLTPDLPIAVEPGEPSLTAPAEEKVSPETDTALRVALQAVQFKLR
jgi:carboxyl-terminal processing protease